MVMQVTPRAAARVLLASLGLLEAPSHGHRPWQRELRGVTGTAEALSRLVAVQVDPVSVVERNHHLVLYNRVRGYRPAYLDSLFAKGQAFEYLANARCILPIQEFPRFWPVMRRIAQNGRTERAALGASIREILTHVAHRGAVNPRKIGNEGPRLLGVGHNAADEESKASGRAIDLLWLGGDLVVSQREGNEKAYNFPERLLSADLLAQLDPPLLRHDEEHHVETTGDNDQGKGPARPWMTPMAHHEEGRAPWSDWLLDRYAQAYHIFEAGDYRLGWQRYPAAERKALVAERVASGDLVSLQIEGVRRPYFATPAAAALAQEADGWEVEPQVRFIPPLDNLLWRRERLEDLFGFSYTWEIYHPPAKRQYGYYTMPILYGDRIIGRIDPKMDRSANRLNLQLLQIEPGVRLGRRDLRRIAKAIDDFARFCGATDWSLLRTEPEGLVLPD